MMNDEHLEDIRLYIQAFAALANSEDFDEFCPEHQAKVRDLLEAFIETEDFMVRMLNEDDKRDPEDIINDQFNKYIRGL